MSEAPPKTPQLIPTIYTQPGCRFCNAAKAWLTERDIPFKERDLTKDETAQDELEQMGLYATPAIVIDGQVILGFDAKALEAALVQKRTPALRTRQAASTDQGP
ncbi:MAG TPA: glutaredoxin family protein [bacterium]|jgi:glutaredoxin|nr:glutaredoxin family protein [bacterium]